MTKLDVSDIKGFALRGYNFPHARFLLLELGEPSAAQAWLLQLLETITTGERWDINKKPMNPFNIGFTYKWPGKTRASVSQPA